MTLSAFILIFISVFLHAGWNFISKAGRPSGAFYLVVNIVSILILLPFLLVSKVQYFSLPPVFWWYVAASVFFEFIYVVGLFQAYKRNDISMAYPIYPAAEGYAFSFEFQGDLFESIGAHFPCRCGNDRLYDHGQLRY